VIAASAEAIEAAAVEFNTGALEAARGGRFEIA
jgi:hypothetical protein